MICPFLASLISLSSKCKEKYRDRTPGRLSNTNHPFTLSRPAQTDPTAASGCAILVSANFLNSPVRNIDYSVVVPVYQNSGRLRPLMQSFVTTVLESNRQYEGEIIFVDDGSTDASLEVLHQIQSEYPKVVKVVKLTRNFGQGMAQLAGYSQAGGICIVTISADGQDSPSLINDMLKAFFDERYDIVICNRAGRDESNYRIATSKLYYSLMRKLAFSNMPEGGFDFWLLSRRALDVFLRHAEPHSSFQGLILWMGFRTKVIAYRRRERVAGVSRFTFGTKLTSVLDGIIAFSFAPIRIISFAGAMFSLVGFVYAGLILIDGLFLGNPVKGWAPLMITILVMGGFQMIMLGIIGEYLWRTLAQARRRERYVIDQIYERTPKLPERGTPLLA
jgi:dolichol-phosphate mannosyltransferase